jgi:hypothetical protein
LRSWLDRITQGAAKRREVAREVAPFLGAKLPVFATLEGQRIRYDYGLNGVEAGVALAAALLVDPSRGLAGRLKRCGWSRCGRYSLDFAPKTRPRRFCPGHKEKFDLETSKDRQRAFRKRQKLKRR